MGKSEKNDKNRSELKKRFSGKCFVCPVCDGRACAGIIPGMGGLGSGKVFMNNFLSWEKFSVDSENVPVPPVVCAPMTGADENIGGYYSEREFQKLLVKGSVNADILPSTGDGTPDYKLWYGLEALMESPREKRLVFIKPYQDRKIMERLELASGITDIAGIDIDSANLVTMKGKAVLEEKSTESLRRIMKFWKKPFVLKGIISEKQIETVRELKPWAIVISNHGGRIDDSLPSSCEMLVRLAGTLKKYVSEIWVDGGIRTAEHARKARALGADRVMIGRPFATATIINAENGIKEYLSENGFCFQS